MARPRVSTTRWWEVAAKSCGLGLPAGLAEIPSWILVDGETRRMSVGPAVRTAGVGVGWTGSVLIEGLVDTLPTGLDVLAILDQAMEGPLWFDLSQASALLEGSICSGSKGFADWRRRLESVEVQQLGPIDDRGVIDTLGERMPGLRVAGTQLHLFPQPSVSVVGQMVLGPDDSKSLGAIAGLCDDLGLVADPRLISFGEHALNRGGRVVDVLVSATGAPRLELRFWNLVADLAWHWLRQMGADDDAVDRAKDFHVLLQSADVARGALSLSTSGALGVELVFDLGRVAN